MSITAEFDMFDKDNKQFFMIKFLDKDLSTFTSSFIITEIGEGLLNSPNNLLFDFSVVEHLSSGCIGSIVNILQKSSDNSLDIFFKLNSTTKDLFTKNGLISKMTIWDE